MCALGVGLALVEKPRGMAPVAATVFLCLGAAAHVLEVPRPWRPHPVLLAFVATGTFGYLALSRPVAALLGLLALVTAPPVVRRATSAVRRERDDVRRRSPGRPAAVAQHVAPEPLPAVVGADDDADAAERVVVEPEVDTPLLGLDDRQLCRLWRETVWRLRAPLPDQEALRIVLVRQACLDELTRRHGAEMRAWLDSGARASSGPERFLEPPRAS